MKNKPRKQPTDKPKPDVKKMTAALSARNEAFANNDHSGYLKHTQAAIAEGKLLLKTLVKYTAVANKALDSELWLDAKTKASVIAAELQGLAIDAATFKANGW